VLTTCASAASVALDGTQFAEKRLRQSVRFVRTNPEAMPIIELDDYVSSTLRGLSLVDRVAMHSKAGPAA
jgi:hypothetical protein